VAALTGDENYRKALETLWDNVVSKKMYITGGIGSRSGGESFGDDYELPNASAYCETCAAIANAFWNHRMFLLSGDSKYIDVLERVLYNGIISGIALSGDLFFYPNPLESSGQHKRSLWFTCACCPSNVTRFVPSVPGYAYATQDDALFVNLFVQSSAEIQVGSQVLQIKQETAYPWDGSVKITIVPEKSKRYAVFVRIPGWARNQPVPSDLYHYMDSSEQNAEIRINGEPIDYTLEKGFARLSRKWEKGDTIELDLPMPIRRVISHESVKENAGKVALERGPVVYCSEWVDNQGQVSNLVLEEPIQLKPEKRDDLFNGVIVLKGESTVLKYADDGKTPIKAKQEFTAIPYYAWAHRGEGEMAVWLQAGVRPSKIEYL